jgi:hypothetical protein
MRKLLVLFSLFAIYSNVILAQGQAPAPAASSTVTPGSGQAQPRPVAKKPVVKKEPLPTKSKEEIIDFIFTKSQKYNVHFAEYKRNVDTVFFNAKVKAELNINEIDTIVVSKNMITIYSKLGIKMFNYDKKKMMPYPEMQLILETHDWDFFEENLTARLNRACSDFLRVLRDEQENRRKVGHDPNDAY